MAVNFYAAPAPAMECNSTLTSPCPCGHCCVLMEEILELISMPCCGAIYHAFCTDYLLDYESNRCDSCKVPFRQDFVDNLRVRTLHKSFTRRAIEQILQELPKLQKVCGICKTEVTNRLKWNECSCWFHTECLARYTEVNNSCPQCSHPISEEILNKNSFIRLEDKTRAVWDFLTFNLDQERKDFIDNLPHMMQKYLTRALTVEHPNKPIPYPDANVERQSKIVRDAYWTPERILSLVYRRHAKSMPKVMKTHFKTFISRIHVCGPQCYPSTCLVLEWLSEDQAAGGRRRSTRQARRRMDPDSSRREFKSCRHEK